MRVGVISHLFPTMAQPVRGVFVRLQTEALARHTVCEVFSGQYPPWSLEPPEDLQVDTTYVPLPWGPGPLPSGLRLLRAFRAYERAAKDWVTAGRFDLLHAHYAFPDGVIACGLSKRLGIPAVVTLHGTDVNVQLGRALVGGWVAGRLEPARRLVVVSPHMVESLGRLAPSLAARTVVVPNGFSRAVHGADACASSSQRTGLVYVGQLTDVKRVPMIVEAFGRVADRMPWDLIVIGEGPTRTAVEHTVRVRGLTDRVHLVGSLGHDEVVRAMCSAGALVLASEREGMPTVVIEALASGTPVVSTEVGGVPSIVRPDFNGLLVPVGDVEALGQALIDAAGMVWDHNAIADDPRLMSWDDVAHRLLDVYREAVDAHV